MAWDSYHEKAALCLLRCDIDTGKVDLPHLTRLHKEAVAREDYESAKSINKLIQELKTKKQKQL